MYTHHQNLLVIAVDVKEGVTARVEIGTSSNKFTKHIHQQKLKMYNCHLTLTQYFHVYNSQLRKIVLFIYLNK